MSEIKDGGPAFPMPANEYAGHGPSWGMSLRDWFATHAPEPDRQRIDNERHSDRNRNPYNDSHKPPLRSETEIRASLAYEYADAMLRARGQS